MNRNIWNLYKESERGKNAIALFTVSNRDVDWAVILTNEI